MRSATRASSRSTCAAWAPNRNLVLVDGRRPQPANAQLVVDINSIPTAAIESVEIISGGASAVYGADAMGGVTNFIMKKNFQGLSLNAQTMVTEQGGGQETSASALVGGNFADDRGNAMLGITYTHRDALMAADRDFYVDGWRDKNTPGGEGIPFSNPQFAANNQPDARRLCRHRPAYGHGGRGRVREPGRHAVPQLGCQPRQGVHRPAERPVQGAGFRHHRIPGTVSANNLNTIVTTPLERYSVFGNAHFDVNDHVTAFLQANMSSMTVDTLLNYAPATSQWAATIPVDGRPIPAQLATLLASRPNPTAPYTLARTLDFAGPRTTHNSTDMYQVLAGVKGDLFNTDWTYEAYYSHGRTSITTEMSGFPGLQNYRAVVQAPNFGKNLNLSSGPPLFFGIKCTTGLPIFTDFTPSQDCINSISGNMRHLTETTQDIAEANFTGDVFSLPAGKVGAAVGVTWRQNSFSWRPDDQLTRPSTNYPIGLFPTSASSGSTNVKELYGELLVPVFHDLPGVQQLNLELGARFSDYNTAGNIWTYKALIDWKIVDNVRLRGGYQLANRAPNVAELYTGATTSVVGFAGADPCMANTLNTWGNTPANTVNRAQVIKLCSDIINRSRGDINQSPWHTNATPDSPTILSGRSRSTSRWSWPTSPATPRCATKRPRPGPLAWC